MLYIIMLYMGDINMPHTILYVNFCLSFDLIDLSIDYLSRILILVL